MMKKSGLSFDNKSSKKSQPPLTSVGSTTEGGSKDSPQDLLRHDGTDDRPDHKVKEIIRLDAEALEETHYRELTSRNPRYNGDTVQFSYKDCEFVHVPDGEYESVLLDVQGWLMHKESSEARQRRLENSDSIKGAQVEDTSNQDNLEEEEEEDGEDEDSDDADEDAEKKTDDGEEDDRKDDGGGDDPDPDAKQDDMDGMEKEEATAPKTKTKKKLTNQFNFSERGVQTYRIVHKDKCIQTYAIPRGKIQGHVTQYNIQDAYNRDAIAKNKRDRCEKIIVKPDRKSRVDSQGTKKGQLSEFEIAVTAKKATAAKILERMVNQNTYDEIAQDCQFYDDPADKFRKAEGRVLPLWEFKYDLVHGLAVTDIYWNPNYYDLFGATFGTLEYNKASKRGYFCAFTLKNPTYPEYIATMDEGVLCLDFHPRQSNYVAIGGADGSVHVFDMQYAPEEYPRTSAVSSKHQGPVWQVLWSDDLKHLHFYSASADGQIKMWHLATHELFVAPIITLFVDTSLQTPEGHDIKLAAVATCFTFHPTNYETLLIGTGEGLIYKCSTAYASTYMFTYQAHSLAVHRVSHNRFVPTIFASCSDDWTVKIWEDGRASSLYSFDLECSVGDVQWAPYSSTVFAAVTADGNVHVYDLQLNKHDAICVQVVLCSPDNVLTRIQFNEKLPIIVAGDKKGIISSMKVSPNLRIKPKKPKKGGVIDPKALEIQKLDKVLSYVREPTRKVVIPEKPPPET